MVPSLRYSTVTSISLTCPGSFVFPFHLPTMRSCGLDESDAGCLDESEACGLDERQPTTIKASSNSSNRGKMRMFGSTVEVPSDHREMLKQIVAGRKSEPRQHRFRQGGCNYL